MLAQEMTARQMDALLDKLRVVRAFDISKVMSALVSYIDGVTGGVSRQLVRFNRVCTCVEFIGSSCTAFGSGCPAYFV